MQATQQARAAAARIAAWFAASRLLGFATAASVESANRRQTGDQHTAENQQRKKTALHGNFLTSKNFTNLKIPHEFE
jgi:hypothetical protein